MTKVSQKKKLSQLESMNETLVQEFKLLDSLLKSVGFTEGLASAKTVARELLKDNKENGEIS